MLPQIYSDIHCLTSTQVVEYDSKFSKSSTIWQKCQRNFTQQLMAHTPKTYQLIHIYFTKSEEYSRWVFYSSLLCLKNHPNMWCFFSQSIYNLIKVYLKFLRVSTTCFPRKKCRTRRDNTNSNKPSWKARNKPSKGHTKNISFFNAQFQRT